MHLSCRALAWRTGKASPNRRARTLKPKRQFFIRDVEEMDRSSVDGGQRGRVSSLDDDTNVYALKGLTISSPKYAAALNNRLSPRAATRRRDRTRCDERRTGRASGLVRLVAVYGDAAGCGRYTGLGKEK